MSAALRLVSQTSVMPFRMPSLNVVRAEATKVSRILVSGRPITGSNEAAFVPECVAWNSVAPSLFKYSYLTDSDQVPDDLTNPTMFALKNLHNMFLSCSPEELINLGFIDPNEDDPDMQKDILAAQCREKIISWLLNAKSDEPEEALPYLQYSVQLYERCCSGMSDVEAVVANPLLYMEYGDALTFSSKFDQTTKKVLERLIEGLPKVPSSRGFLQLELHLVKARINLAQVLKQMGVEPRAQKEHVEFAVKFLRKRRAAFYEANLVQMLGRKNQPLHPVLEALGGPDWLAHKVTLRAQERMIRRCAQCLAAEPIKKVFQCSGCQYACYCSKECQKANWSSHKGLCRERAALNKKLQELKTANPEKAQLIADLHRWCDSPHEANREILMHALGLHKDPSRGNTHIVVRQLEYNPGASKDLRRKFRVDYCGVFKIPDFLTDFENYLGLGSGQGKKYIDDLLKSAAGFIPLLTLTMVEGVDPYIRCDKIDMERLRAVTYLPNWREKVNKGAPAKPMLLHSGVQDAEHVF